MTQFNVTSSLELQVPAFTAAGGVPYDVTATLELQAPAFTAAGSVTGGFMVRPQVWDGNAWEPAPTRVWDGTEWVLTPVYVWDGSAWVTDFVDYPAPPGALPMRIMGVTGDEGDQHIWWTGAEPVWMLVPVTDDAQVDPPTGEENDLAAFSDLSLGQELHITGDFSMGSLPLTAMSFWISQDHQDHWQTLIAEFNETHFNGQAVVGPRSGDDPSLPYYWGLGLWVTPLDGHRNVVIRRLNISDGTTTYTWPPP